MNDEANDNEDASADEFDEPSQVRPAANRHHLLNVFRELTLFDAIDRLDEVADAVAAKLVQPWRRATEHDKTNLDAIVGMNWRVFERARDTHLPGAFLFLAPHTRERYLYVSNIVPTESTFLGAENYNSILTEFADTYAIPVAHALGIRCELSDDWVDFADELGETAFTALLAAAIYKPGTHPLDRRRWMDFLLTAHRADIDIDSDRLRRWLEADGFSPDRAWDLMAEFDFARELLKLKDRR